MFETTRRILIALDIGGILLKYVRGRIQKFPDWSPGARPANVIALCHQMQLYRWFVSQSS
jgi:hypothetical protein